MSHTLEHEGFRMIGNPDLSGTVMFKNAKTGDYLYVPGELVVKWILFYGLRVKGTVTVAGREIGEWESE